MTHRTISFAAGAWMAFSAVLGAVLAVRGVRAMMGLVPFAWWHLPALGFGVMMSIENLEAPDRAYLSALRRLLRMKAAASFVKIRTRVRLRAARGLAALYPLHRRSAHPKIQTEP